MKRKVLKILIIIVAMTFSSFMVCATDEGVMLACNGFEKQEKTKWCWVASARNSVHYETDNHRTQKAAVYHIKGSLLNWYPNETGTIYEIEEAAEYISKDTEDYYAVESTLSFVQLQMEVDYSNATIATAGYYNNGVRTGGHAVVIYGYYISGTDEYILYHDPLDNTTHTCLYSDFCDGSYNSAIYEHTCINFETN